MLNFVGEEEQRSSDRASSSSEVNGFDRPPLHRYASMRGTVGVASQRLRSTSRRSTARTSPIQLTPDEGAMVEPHELDRASGSCR